MALQRFTSGPAETVDRLNELVDALNQVLTITGDPFIRATSSPSGGTTLRLNIDEVMRRITRYRNVAGGDGSSGTGNPALSRWFELIDTSSSPMLGQRQTCANGVFSDAEVFSAAEGTSIYPHPQSVIGDYTEGDIIFANFVGNCWVSVNLFGDVDDVPGILFDVCP